MANNVMLKQGFANAMQKQGLPIQLKLKGCHCNANTMVANVM